MKKGLAKIIGSILLGLGTFSIYFLFIFFQIFQMVDSDAVQYQSPGTYPIGFPVAGEYTVWHNYQTIFEGESFNVDADLPHGIRFRLVEIDSGTEIPFQTAKTRMTTSTPTVQKVGVGSFEIPGPGDYQLSIEGGPPRIFSVSEGDFGDFIKTFLSLGLSAMGVMLIALLCLALFIWGIVDVIKALNEKKGKN